MSRTVSAVVTAGPESFGEVGPFAVSVPWWSEVGEVVDWVSAAIGVPVHVLRLLSTDGDGMRGGHVRYHAEALRRPDRPGVPFAVDDNPLRSSWARADGLRDLLDWAASTLAALGRPLTGPARQRRTWNLSALFTLPTASGPVWLKATPPFAADEAAVIAAFAAADPTAVPTVVASAPGRLLIEDIPGADCWETDADTVAGTITRFVAAQAAAVPPPGLPHRTLLIDPLLSTLPELTVSEIRAAERLAARWPELAECGLPTTLVHGDFHPGNWRSACGPTRVLDFADAYVGDPFLDGLRARDFLPAHREIVTTTWCAAWRERVPGCDPERALRIGEPLAHLMYAVRYQEFLDGIEESERIYHLGDPAASVQQAISSAEGG
ncbi:aminoglycoside phosphotransferase family protein [Actinokineospora sp. HUAS TT18]|uniref:aminoglycoside phosphotransferase family protein n=1 Tax=Actinokineospora sp. HUAS TT18 TaxID=3447451 RepID=UPI003F51B914